MIITPSLDTAAALVGTTATTVQLIIIYETACDVT